MFESNLICDINILVTQFLSDQVGTLILKS